MKSVSQYCSDGVCRLRKFPSLLKQFMTASRKSRFN